MQSLPEGFMGFTLTITPAIPPRIRHKLERVLQQEGFTFHAGGTDVDRSICDIAFSCSDADALWQEVIDRASFIDLVWLCPFCREERPDRHISVKTNDLSAKFGLPSGTMYENIKYCNDRKDCTDRAKAFSYFHPPTEE